MWATFVNFQQQLKVNKHPIGENSLNLVTLLEMNFFKFRKNEDCPEK
jgi:hypothetical protein